MQNWECNAHCGRAPSLQCLFPHDKSIKRWLQHNIGLIYDSTSSYRRSTLIRRDSAVEWESSAVELQLNRTWTDWSCGHQIR